MSELGDEVRGLKAAEHELGILYEGYYAGFFVGPHRPSVEGRYRYKPHRGGGYYKLHCALRDGAHPRCTFRARPDISFTVLSCPEYGVLELSDFTVGDGGQHLVSLE